MPIRSRSKSPAPKRAGTLPPAAPLPQKSAALDSGGAAWGAFILVLALTVHVAVRLLASGAGLIVSALVALLLLNFFAVVVLAYGFHRVTREQPVCRITVVAGPSTLDAGSGGGSGTGAPVLWTVSLALPAAAAAAATPAVPPPVAREYEVCGDTWLLGATVVLFKAWAVAWAGAEPRCVLDRLQGHCHDATGGQRGGLVHRLAPPDSAGLCRLCARLLQPWLLDTAQYTAVAPAPGHAMAKGEAWDVVQNGLGGLVARAQGNQRPVLERAASAMRGVGRRAVAALVGR